MNEIVTSTLKDQWIAFREQNPKVRIRDAAKQLQVSEGEVVAACTGKAVQHLKPEFQALMERMPELGKVMVLTRNENCVIERKGLFEQVDAVGRHVGTVLGKDIDLRMFFSRWKFGFAVEDDAVTGFKRSLQFFDAQGHAIMKIYSLDQTDMGAWDIIVAAFMADEQPLGITVAPAPAATVYANETADKVAFLEGWAALQDTHDFFPLLMKHKVSRTYALEIGEGTFTRRIGKESVKKILESAAASGLEVMVFVGNPGNIEIHTGKVEKILEIPGWINVMDPDFNLHLKTDDIAQSWAVQKPGVDGVVTSVEVFDSAGEMIAQFFGKRKPGNPELEAWRKLVAEL
ncbi:hemin-degrading factor [Chitinophaga sancti]|uniref:ChuX/HutX family heme-like substrate-binding protein n=1 Tax=Chitinophaga sancti TaxID=1004 RepID=A0A1K1PKF9_9BACT|nr:ChuX/HutX family heme-like substrate-binding protein [Chitinophaga sancti]WQD59417.1 ChuX/HutX family heme-like substrate-binding protein [Chitinophaga sancti]WQG88449.1 ChuX/HutX family heme-like substrate-binding protein [Chitinophaga sancti]SFW47158.1 putative hemin transport protein [Chitinophaga sancti]